MQYLKSDVLKNSFTIILFSIIILFAVLIFYCFIQLPVIGNTINNKSDTLIIKGEKHFKNVIKLTDDGDNAEAYFSFDGTKIVFQSNREPYKCDQIFTMNLDGSDVKLVSTGKGRTTCSYFYPDGKFILYASTHLGSDDCPPPPDMSHGYTWALYDTYDIFKADLNGNVVQRLTSENAYDAEATVSFKGDKIIFTSTRDGDIELYSMNLDGSDVKRLTFEPGYDGGAYYSYDGSNIVYRASRPESDEELKEYKELLSKGLVKPSKLEIYVMNADGSDKVRLTNFKAASFAPYFFPDGNKIIFCSNVDDPKGRNFDLFSINIDGTGLEKITYNDTFDGFPMFSKDGKKFVFCSNRAGKTKYSTNVFVCDWVD